MMSEVFEGKVRRLGNSLAVIIPQEVLAEAGIREGDMVKLAIPVDAARRKQVFRRIAGIDEGKPGFKRDKQDRMDRL